MHLHLAPDTVVRTNDDLQFAGQAEQIGYKGFMLKDHFTGTAPRAYLVSRMFPKMTVAGGLVLNRSIGGLNPSAVEMAIKVGAKEIWMPTFDALNHYNHFHMFSLPGLVEIHDMKSRRPSNFAGLSILDSQGNIKDEVMDVLELVSDANVVVATGHISLGEVTTLLRYAKKVGVRKFLVTHPEFVATRWSASDQVELAGMGAIIEHCANLNYDAALTAANIKAVGADKCILSSDSGQIRKGHPSVYMSKFVQDLKAQGISERELHLMLSEGPSKLLEID